METMRQDVEIDCRIVASVLRRVRGWLLVVPLSKGEAARDGAGMPVCPLMRSARAFCLQGLVIRCFPDIDASTFRLIIQLLHEAVKKLTRNQHETLFSLADDPATTRVTLVRLVDEVLDRTKLGKPQLTPTVTHGSTRSRSDLPSDPQASSNGFITA